MFKFKIQGLLLLLSLTLPVMTQLGSYLLLKHKFEKNAKQNLAASIDKSELVLLKFSLDDAETILHWKEENEFEYNGEMYDVIKRFFIGNEVCYYCWPDKSETELNIKLQSLIRLMLGNHPTGKTGLQLIYDFLITLYFSACEEIQFNSIFIKKNLFNYYTFEEIARSVTPPYLPPE